MAHEYPFQNPDLPIEKRVTDLLSRMSREEKIKCLGTVPDVARLGVAGTGHVEGLHGLAMGEIGNWGGEDPVPTTQFPQAIGLGESWDPALVRQVGEAEGKEVRFLWESPKYRRGGLVVRAPNADLGRDPRWGRTEECFGEDPFLVGTLAVAMTKGLQGTDRKHLQAASLLKHFLANSNENDRTKTSSNFDARLFHEYYAAPFRMAIMEGGAQGMMTAYNAVNGVPCQIAPHLREVVLKQWGHDGIICTDGGGLGLLVSDQKHKDLAGAAADTIQAGVNQFLDRHDRPTRGAFHRGLLTETDVDDVLRGVFRVMIRLGQLDPRSLVPYKKVGGKAPWDSQEHKALALKAAQRSVVLLKNEGPEGRGMLPIDPSSVKSVAVIGPYADKVLADWYGGDAPYLVSPVEGVQKRLGDGVTVRFAKDNKDGKAEKLARISDLVVVCAGNHPVANGGWAKRDSLAEGKESLDRDLMDLRQEELIKKCLAANPNTVVALITSFPHTMEWTAKNAPAILKLTHSGQEQGTALAGALFGDFNPGGKLTLTWPRSLKDLPPMLDYDIRHGRTYMYFKKEPLYHFGYGLSYTTFELSGLKLDAKKLTGGGKLTATLLVTNQGMREGDEVVQLYVRYPSSKVERPDLQLKAFQRVTIPAGKTKSVSLTLRATDLAYWDETKGDWALEPGKVEVLAGTSAVDLKLTSAFEVID